MKEPLKDWKENWWTCAAPLVSILEAKEDAASAAAMLLAVEAAAEVVQDVGVVAVCVWS